MSQLVAFAHAAAVKRLHLLHHDPEQTDEDIGRELEEARAALVG